jgi:RNA polymerase sigma factor (sigma-70 family)
MRSTSARSSTSAEEAIAATYRAEWGRLLSVLVVRTRRLDLAEDALAEAFARAAQRWPADGVPINPAGWLYTTAHRIILGRLRANAVAGRRAPLLAARPVTTDAATVVAEIEPDGRDDLRDEQLQLVLLCCHPALDPASRSALALRLVMGIPTAEIARLFLVPTPTMAARITRAKRKIVSAGIPLSLPAGDELDRRLDAVARTIYLAFTAAYSPGTGAELLRVDEAGEAVRLAEVLVALVPDAAQARALLALLMLQHSRRDARVEAGVLVTMDRQDRKRWHHDEIAAAVQLIETTRPTGGFAEELWLQAAAAREHAIATSADATDWRVIESCYARLEDLTGSPIVRLNRAIALAEIEGAEAGLSALDALGPALEDHHHFHATRADLARRTGDVDTARTAYRAAIERCANLTERSFLLDRLDRLDGVERLPSAAGSDAG